VGQTFGCLPSALLALGPAEFQLNVEAAARIWESDRKSREAAEAE